MNKLPTTPTIKNIKSEEKRNWSSDISENEDENKINHIRIPSMASEITDASTISINNSTYLNDARRSPRDIESFKYRRIMELHYFLPEDYLKDRTLITIQSGVWLNIKSRFCLDYVRYKPEEQTLWLCSHNSEKNVKNAKKFIKNKVNDRVDEFMNLVHDCVTSYNNNK
jgi:hypothetical protein